MGPMMRDEWIVDAESPDAPKMVDIQSTMGSQYRTKTRSLSTPNENKCNQYEAIQIVSYSLNFRSNRFFQRQEKCPFEIAKTQLMVHI
jgi:hypothetical protein